MYCDGLKMRQYVLPIQCLPSIVKTFLFWDRLTSEEEIHFVKLRMWKHVFSCVLIFKCQKEKVICRGPFIRMNKWWAAARAVSHMTESKRPSCFHWHWWTNIEHQFVVIRVHNSPQVLIPMILEKLSCHLALLYFWGVPKHCCELWSSFLEILNWDQHRKLIYDKYCDRHFSIEASLKIADYYDFSMETKLRKHMWPSILNWDQQRKSVLISCDHNFSIKP